VHGVAKLLRRMVRNLLENARRHGTAMQGDCAIVVCLGQENSQFGFIKVCDRGPGVPAEFKDRIFEPFFRPPGASEGSGGVGLGLALVKSIAVRHGWQVRCEERLGGGTCFLVT
jgi:signal transduction histidine kinase